MTIALALIVIGLIVFLAHALEDLYARTKVPDVLLLLGLGILVGPAFHLVLPESLGAVGPVFTTLTLVIILFEGGLGLHTEQLLGGLRGALLLTVLNFVATVAVVAPLARVVLNLDWMSAAILGAVLGGTSSAVVIPLVGRLRLGEGSRTALALESALSDVLVIVVALGLMEAQKAGALHPGTMLGGMLASFSLAVIIGVLGGIAWSLALSRIHGLQNSLFTTPAFVCVVFGVVELLGYSGAITALALGITLGNLDRVPARFLRSSPEALASLNATERQVFAEVVFLLKTYFFVYIGLSIRIGGWGELLTGLLFVGALYLVRLPVVHASLRPGKASGRDALASLALIPKGLAAAVVAGVPLQMGLPGGGEIRNTAYAVILLSILGTSVLVFLLERRWLDSIQALLFGRYAVPEPPEADAEPLPPSP